MNIFTKRPLGLVLCIALCGFSLFSLSDGPAKIILLSLSAVLLALSLFVPFLKKNIIRVSSLALLCSFILSFIYFQLIFYPSTYFDRDVEVKGEILSIEKTNEYFSVIDLKTKSIDGENRNYKIKLYLYSENSSLESGTVITVQTKPEKFAVGEDFDFNQYYTSQGFSAKCSADSCEISDKNSPSITYKLSSVRSKLIEYATVLTDKNTGGLIGALLFGERDKLSPSVSLDFQRIGIIHILSLSGMHLAILSGFLDRLLYVLRVKRKLRSIATIIFSIGFMALTGFPITVCRAGFMLIISALLMLITGTKDSITSLFVAAAIIIAVNPYSACDLGLWLSVLSTLGILAAVEVSADEKTSEVKVYTVKAKIISYVKLSLVFSVFAILASLVVTATSFNAISLLSILTTLIFSLPIEIFVYLSIAMMAFGKALPLSKPVITIVNAISSLAAKISDIEGIYVSTDFIEIKLLSFASALVFFAFFFIKIKKKKILIPVFTVILSAIFTVSYIKTEIIKNTDDFICTAKADGDRMIIKEEGKVLMFDSSSHSISDAYAASALLSELNLTELDEYYLPNYTKGLPESIDKLLGRNLIRKILLPLPQSNEEHNINLEIIAVTDKYRCKTVYYDTNTSYSFQNTELMQNHRNKDSYTYLFVYQDALISYYTDGALDYCYNSYELLYSSDIAIFGEYGTDYDYNKIIDEFSSKLQEIIILNDKVFADEDLCNDMNVRVTQGQKIVYLKNK